LKTNTVFAAVDNGFRAHWGWSTPPNTDVFAEIRARKDLSDRPQIMVNRRFTIKKM